MPKILIVDDEIDICNALRIYLSAENYEIVEAHNGQEALDAVKAEGPDLILMDIMMPVMDGITATSRLREITNVPIILLTAKSEDSDKVLGLNIGADDYITKPFHPNELNARVRSQLRRYTQLGAQTVKDDVLRIGGVELNDIKKTVTVDNDPVSLTPMEYGILKLLMENPGRVFSSAAIYEAVWNDQSIGNESTVAVHIRHLREKIEINPSEPRYIKVVWGQGYKMEEMNAR
ncbi:MAG: response regulator transcription factor [Solobacterium sp.]|nr:response regulator transcription factor [Solobacterium sp.]